MKQGAVDVHTDGVWLAIPAPQEDGRPALPAPTFGPPKRTDQTAETVKYRIEVKPFVLGPRAPTSDGAWLTGQMSIRVAAGRMKPAEPGQAEDPLSTMARLAAAILLARRKAEGRSGPGKAEE